MNANVQNFNYAGNSIAVQIFNNPEFGSIRVVTNEKSDPFFVANDAARILGYSNPRDAIAKHCKSWGVAKCDIPVNGINQSMTIINEPNFYRLVMRSNMPDAEKIQDWVCEDILPSIRRTGGYVITRSNDTPEEIMARAIIVAQETIKNSEQKIMMLESKNALQTEQLKQSAPKVQYFDTVLTSTNTYTTTQIAKEFGYGAETLNRKLCEMGVQYKQNGQWLLKAKYQGKDYTKSITRTYTKSDGTTGSQMQTVWTEKGRLFIHELLNA